MRFSLTMAPSCRKVIFQPLWGNSMNETMPSVPDTYVSDRRAELLARADAGLAELAEKLIASDTTEAFAQWLAWTARFHRYSIRNQWLIYSQRPEATHVASFGRWKALGRYVNKGEKGLQILAPIFPRVSRDAKKSETDPLPAELRPVGWKVVHVFDVSQTAGAALPEHPASNREEVSADDLARVERAIRRVCPIVDEVRPLAPGVLGWADGKSVHVSPGQSSGSRMAVLLHEVGHMLLHFADDGRPSTSAELHLTRDVRELEAESVACAVSTALGFKFTGFAAAYLAGYGATAEGIKASLPRIQRAASRIIGLIFDGDESINAVSHEAVAA
jgi:antirestriction protein ArdC